MNKNISIPLEKIQEYCNGKKIALVGNSTKLLNENNGKSIDSNDIIIRLNYSIDALPKYKNALGEKTHIFVPQMNTVSNAVRLCKAANAKYILQLSRWSKTGYSDRENKLLELFNNVYICSKEFYDEFRRKDFKIMFIPSTGAATFNFLVTRINFLELNLYGFDFFENFKQNEKNVFRSIYHKSHSSIVEKTYFTKYINKANNITLM